MFSLPLLGLGSRGTALLISLFLRFMHIHSAKLHVVESHFFLYLFICCIESVLFEFGILHLVVVQYT